MSQPARKLPWLDLETTGFTELNKRKVYDHRILELGAVVTDDHFNVLGTYSVVVQQPMDLVLSLCDDTVLRMHTDNGLLNDVAHSAISLEAAEAGLIEFYREHGVGVKGAPLCGNGIHFDRMFIEAQMPVLDAYLYYRNLDVSAVKEFLKLVSPEFEPAKRKCHRALDDILESVNEAQIYRGLLVPFLGC